MTFAYRFGGLAIRSSVLLEGLRWNAHEACAPDITLTLQSGAAPAPDHVVFRWPGRYATRLATLGDCWRIDSSFDGVFVVDRAIAMIAAYSAAMPPHAEMTDVLVRRILPRLVTARGAVTIHAAAVATGGRALVLLGASGAGKSTLTAALAVTPGWHLLSDDLSMLRPGAPAMVVPGATGVCVWPASRDGLALDAARCTAMPGYDGKVRFDPPAPPSTAPVPLGALVFLDRDPAATQATLVPIDRAGALVRAAQQLIAFNPAAPPRAEYAGLFTRLASVVQGVPILRLTYPSCFSALPEVAATLAGLIVR